MYVYIESERWRDDEGFTRVTYTVGFYDPAGKWHSESDHGDSAAAATRTAWLNGKAE